MNYLTDFLEALLAASGAGDEDDFES